MNVNIQIDQLKLEGMGRHQLPSFRRAVQSELQQLAKHGPASIENDREVELDQIQIELSHQETSTPRQAGRKLARRLYKSAFKNRKNQSR